MSETIRIQNIWGAIGDFRTQIAHGCRSISTDRPLRTRTMAPQTQHARIALCRSLGLETERQHTVQ